MSHYWLGLNGEWLIRNHIFLMFPIPCDCFINLHISAENYLLCFYMIIAYAAKDSKMIYSRFNTIPAFVWCLVLQCFGWKSVQQVNREHLFSRRIKDNAFMILKLKRIVFLHHLSNTQQILTDFRNSPLPTFTLDL
ncbi:uncharacterized protein [Populus alba]|uniref:uncharacterized protein n=1 Tax=Populus alba TaxID=43335 RepID=UPI003CC76664